MSIMARAFVVTIGIGIAAILVFFITMAAFGADLKIPKLRPRVEAPCSSDYCQVVDPQTLQCLQRCATPDTKKLYPWWSK